MQGEAVYSSAPTYNQSSDDLGKVQENEKVNGVSVYLLMASKEGRGKHFVGWDDLHVLRGSVLLH